MQVHSHRSPSCSPRQRTKSCSKSFVDVDDRVDDVDVDDRVVVDRLEDVTVVVTATCVMILVLTQVTTPPTPEEHEEVGTVTLMLRTLEIVRPPGQVTRLLRPVEQEVTVVTL